MSIAVFVTVNCVNSLTVWPPCDGRLGPLWMALTVTVNLLVAVNCGFAASNGSLLVTTVVNKLVLGTWPT